MKISKIIFQAKQVISREYPRAAVFRFFNWLLYIVEGKFLAYCVGWNKAYVGRGARIIGTRSMTIGENLSIGRCSWIEAVFECGARIYCPVIVIGAGFSASERLHISAINRIEIGDNCLFGSCAYISDHNHGSYKKEGQSYPGDPPVDRALVSHGPVVIGSNVWIGDNVVIVGSVRIGDGVVIGANSVVTSDVPDNVIVAGVPAKVLKKYNHNNNQWEAFSETF